MDLSLKCYRLKETEMFAYLVLLLICIAGNVHASNSCSQKDKSTFYLDVATDMISKAKSIIPSCAESRNCSEKPQDCTDVHKMGHNRSGVYTIWPMNRVIGDRSLNVYCDMDTDGGGWTVIQRRGNFSNPIEYFYKEWKEYKEGFGNLLEEFWLGNEYIYALTNQKKYEIRIDLGDFDGNKRYAVYESFWIESEKYQYLLNVKGYSGNADDSLSYHNGMKFSTKDKNNDASNHSCAQKFKGAWWFQNCYYSHLNGAYRKSENGIDWDQWKKNLATAEMKIRRTPVSNT